MSFGKYKENEKANFLKLKELWKISDDFDKLKRETRQNKFNKDVKNADFEKEIK